MLSVLNINPVPLQQETIAQLEQMGFTPDLINKAHTQSQDKSVAGLLNWLLEHQSDPQGNSKESDSKANKESSNNVVASSKKKSKNSKKYKNSE